MLRTCPHCGQPGIVDTQPWVKADALSSMWAFAACHACSGRYTIVRAGAAEKLPELLVPIQKAKLATLPQMVGKIRIGLNLVAASAVCAILIAAPAVFLISKSHRGPESHAAVDSLKTSLAAPKTAANEALSLVIAHVDPASAILRAGPGAQYRRLGSVAQGADLSVKSVLAAWVEVLPPRAIALSDLPPPAHGYWIRRDLVKLRSPGTEATP